MNYEATVKVLLALEREHVRYVVFGGAAVNLHGLPRFTEDLDLFVAPERENVEALERALFSVFGDPEIDGISADDLEAVRLSLEGLTVSVASPATLFRMKKDTVRAKDRMDAEALRHRFGLREA